MATLPARLLVLAPAAAVAGVLLVGAPAQAQVACDSYSGGCLPLDGGTDQPAKGGKDDTAVVDRNEGTTTRVDSRTDVSPATLPFTGGELVLGSLLGLTAVGTGAVLVVAGRRRTPSPV